MYIRAYIVYLYLSTHSDDSVMRPRHATLDVAPHGSAYLRLWFNGLRPEQGTLDVFLFLNDDIGQNEENFLFRVTAAQYAGY